MLRSVFYVDSGHEGYVSGDVADDSLEDNEHKFADNVDDTIARYTSCNLQECVRVVGTIDPRSDSDATGGAVEDERN